MMHFLQSGWKTVPCVNIPALQNTRVRAGKRGGTNRREGHIWIMFVHLIAREAVLFHSGIPATREKKSQPALLLWFFIHMLFYVLTLEPTGVTVRDCNDR